MMLIKNVLKLSLFVFLLSCSKTVKKKNVSKVETAKAEKKEVKRVLELCNLSEVKSNMLFNVSFFSENKVNLKQIPKNRLYNNIPVVFNDLFKSQYIQCISPFSSNKYNVFDIFYSDSKKSEEVYNNIAYKLNNYKVQNDKKGYYHDFFKRGIVLVLDATNNKITLISFNPFLDKSLPKKIEQFFIKNSNQFEKVFMSTGVTSVKELIN